MLFKETACTVADNSGALWVKLFHLYGGWRRRSSSVGNFLKASARVVLPPKRGFHKYKYKPVRRGFIYKCVAVRINHQDKRPDGSILH